MKPSYILACLIVVVMSLAGCSDDDVNLKQDIGYGYLKDYKIRVSSNQDVSVGDTVTIAVEYANVVAVVHQGGDSVLKSIYYKYDDVESGKAFLTRRKYVAFRQGVDTIRICDDGVPSFLDTTIVVYVGSQKPASDSDTTSNPPQSYSFSLDTIVIGGIDKNCTIDVSGPKYLGCKVIDSYVASDSGDNQSSASRSVTIKGNYVGATYVKFYNSDFDTLIPVVVLPQHNTYKEPPLDFDDTRDSVVAKLGQYVTSNDTMFAHCKLRLDKTMLSREEKDDTSLYCFYPLMGETWPYVLTIVFTPQGNIDYYVIDFADYKSVYENGELLGTNTTYNSDIRTELLMFLQERYKSKGSLSEGTIYARFFDTWSANLVDATTTVVACVGKNYLIYCNPKAYYYQWRHWEMED